MHMIQEDSQKRGAGEYWGWGGQQGIPGQTLCGVGRRGVRHQAGQRRPLGSHEVLRGMDARSGQRGREMHKPGPEKAPLCLQ